MDCRVGYDAIGRDNEYRLTGKSTETARHGGVSHANIRGCDQDVNDDSGGISGRGNWWKMVCTRKKCETQRLGMLMERASGFEERRQSLTAAVKVIIHDRVL